MAKSKHHERWDENEAYAWKLAKSERRRRRERELEDKQRSTQRPAGLRSQGEAGSVRTDRAAAANSPGRRAAPTRYDAMAIAGHQRLPGWEMTTNPEDSTARTLQPLEPSRGTEPLRSNSASSDEPGPSRSVHSAERPERVTSDQNAPRQARANDDDPGAGIDDPSGSKSQTRGRPSSDALET